MQLAALSRSEPRYVHRQSRSQRVRRALGQARDVDLCRARLAVCRVVASGGRDGPASLERNLNAYGRVLRRYTPTSVGHHLWPMHALQSGLRLHFGLLLAERDIVLSRLVGPRKVTAMDNRAGTFCWYGSNASGGAARRPVWRFAHPRILDRQCPFGRLLQCERNAQGSCDAYPSEGTLRNLPLPKLASGGAKAKDPGIDPRAYQLRDETVTLEDVVDPDHGRTDRTAELVDRAGIPTRT